MNTTQPFTLTTPRIVRWLALSMVAGQVLFTLAWLILGFLSPGFTIFGTLIAPYSPISAGISGLGLGPTAPYMNAAFVLNGLLTMAGVVGIFLGIREMSDIARWSCSVLLGLSGLGIAMDGIFTLESFLLHFVGFILGAGTPVVGFLVAGSSLRHIPSWRRFGSWLRLAGPLTLVLLVLYFLTFTPTAEGAKTGVAGLTERILCVELAAWFVAMGWKAFQQSR
ncbi:MAG TPA: DUF998 domain-containing protein [Anaerolineales bacterium]|nr:DUF998 domain-containing protein [Anaerolineales bacterium]